MGLWNDPNQKLSRNIRPKPLQGDANKHAKHNDESGLPTQSFANPKGKDTVNTTEAIQRKTEPKPNDIMKPTSLGGPSSLAPIAKSPEKSVAVLTPLETAKSTLMSSIDDSGQHLIGLMKGLFANQPPSDVRSYDPDRVRAACACADQVHKLMRLKYDVIKNLGDE